MTHAFLGEAMLTSHKLARVASATLCVWLSACNATEGTRHDLKAPETARADEQVLLAVTGEFTGEARFQWSATSGHFEGPVDRPTVTFVPTRPGPVTVVFTLKSESGTSVVRDATINVTGETTVASPGQVGSGSAGVPLIIENEFVPSGWMGDGAEVGQKSVTMTIDRERPRSGPTSHRVGYQPGGRAGWAAIAWQYPENNWGGQPGKDLRAGGYREVSVWARGLPDRRGNFPMVQFKAGGATDPTLRYPASFEVVGDFVTLTAEWKEHVLQLSGRNLSNVAAAFVVVMRAQDVDQGATFFLDDIKYR